MQVQSLASLSVLRIQHCHKLRCKLQMWLGSVVAAALIQSLAWELPYATGAALKKKNKQTTSRSKDRKHAEYQITYVELAGYYSCGD